MVFEQPLFRFAVTGTLIALYAAVDHAARRAGGDPRRARVRPPRALAIAVFVSVLAFYMTIRPYGGAWAGGAGNLAGIAVAFGAMAVRWRSRRGVRPVRQPEIAARLLFYTALPAAVGVASGWLTLTLPAVLTSAWWSVREDQLLEREWGPAWRDRMAESARWCPGLW